MQESSQPHIGDPLNRDPLCTLGIKGCLGHVCFVTESCIVIMSGLTPLACQLCAYALGMGASDREVGNPSSIGKIACGLG